MKDYYLTIANETNYEMIEKKSKFIATVKEVESIEKAKIEISKLRKKYKDASHNTYAYIIRGNVNYKKYSDDKEPQGTAGLPILDVLENNNIVNVLVVVSRYFGGTKLGVGGLVRAYKNTASGGIKKAGISKIGFGNKVKIICSYNLNAILKNYLLNNKIVIDETIFTNDVTTTIKLLELDIESQTKNITNLLNGNCDIIIEEKLLMKVEEI